MFSTRTKKVISYGRRAQRFVPVSNDRSFNDSTTPEEKQMSDLKLILDASEAEDEVDFYEHLSVPGILYEPVKNSCKERRRYNAPSKRNAARRFTTETNRAPARRPLGICPTNVPKSPAVLPKSSRSRAGIGKGASTKRQKLPTISSHVDVDIIILDNAGRRLSQERRITKSNDPDVQKSRRTSEGATKRAVKPTPVRSYYLSDSEGEGDEDDEYVPEAEEIKDKRVLREAEASSPTIARTARTSRRSKQPERVPTERDSAEEELYSLRKPRASKRAAHAVIVSESESDHDISAPQRNDTASKLARKPSAPVRVSAEHQLAQPKVPVKKRELAMRNRQVEVVIPLVPRVAMVSSTTVRVSLGNKQDIAMRPQPALAHMSPTHTVPASEDRFLDSDLIHPRPRQLTPIRPTRSAPAFSQQILRKSSPSHALAFTDDDSSIDEELELALKVADLELSESAPSQVQGLSTIIRGSMTRPRQKNETSSSSQLDLYRPHNPPYLRPLLSECGQITPFDFTAFIETFPVDPIIDFSDHTGFSADACGRKPCPFFQKVGEASYSEVFGIGSVVLKVIPLFDEGNDISAACKAEWETPPVSEVEDVLKEILVTRAMGEVCKGFIKLLRVHVVQGSYPPRLIKLWDEYNETKGSESVRPDSFSGNQAYVIIILPNGGLDLESFSFNSPTWGGGSGWKQACSVFWQVTRSLERAEELLHFEHRDLHWGQILVRHIPKSFHFPKAATNGLVYMDDLSHGVRSTIIDLGLSRIDHGLGDAYWTPFTEEIFQGEGDYQYDVYRMMREYSKNEWQSFRPLTNVMWLHYLADKLINHKHIRKPPSRVSGRPSRKSLHPGAGTAAVLEADKRAYECLIEVEKMLWHVIAPVARRAGLKLKRRSKSAKVPEQERETAKIEINCAADVLQLLFETAWASLPLHKEYKMALPFSLQNSMLPAELEFVASEELIEIRPTVKMERIRFISGIYGPFVGGRLTKVPLWIATNLKLKKKCNIVPPGWLSVEFLQAKLAEETGSQAKDVFVRFPFRYAEIAKVLLDVASDNVDQPDKLRMLLKDIRETRQSKIRDNLEKLDHTSLQLKGICATEINEVRPFLSRAMGVLIQLNVTDPAVVCMFNALGRSLPASGCVLAILQTQHLLTLSGKSFVIAPCDDLANPDDYFLFTASDNNFLTTEGRFGGQSFNGGMDVDNQFMVFRATLPTVSKGSVEHYIGI
ncbi:hypothetical protein M0805_005374 [Coniferiporia weirii]|nr:hypothetical protein M0805_005374 [Coniferiporia weirii]